MKVNMFFNKKIKSNMKRNFILTTLLLLIVPFMSGQSTVMTISENFDGSPVSFNSTPAGSWSKHTNYAVSSPNSYRAKAPTYEGDTVALETPVYDFSKNSHVQMRFNHICKISPSDIACIEYRTSMGTTMGAWQPIPKEAYLGSGTNYTFNSRFNAANYSEWQSKDSLAIPSASWWKEEIFDLSIDAGMEDGVQFRFLLIHGPVAGTQISYGWLLDNFEIRAADHPLDLPVVEFLAPFVKDTVYNAASLEINAKVATRTSARIENPLLIYTAVNSRETITDTLSMINVRGDSLWRATIPQFLVGTKISYSIIGRDTVGNYATASSWYFIDQRLELIAPFIKDTVYNMGPFSIHAKAMPKTFAHINPPSLIYTAINSQETITDTIAMTNILGDSLWQASIPQFDFDTEVSYTVTMEDTVGNYLSTSSWFMTKQPTVAPEGFRYAGDTNSTDYTEYVPYNPYYEYGWSRALVLGSEIDQYEQGGLITSIAYFPTYYGRELNMNNQSLYFKAVDDEYMSNSAYLEPLADEATLVWEGTIMSPQVNQWMEIELSTSFILPANSNLLIYWINNDGRYEDDAYWRCTYYEDNMIVENENDGSFPTGSGYLDTYRPNMRFYVIGNLIADHSTAISSIDVADTIFVSPDILQVPIIYTVINKGVQDLDSARVSYSVNGSAPTYSTLYLNPALPSIAQFQDTIAYYTPRINQFDTIVVKIELPNGEYDVNEWDNELTKNVYGAADIQMSFVNPVTDTIYKAGPFEIAAQITSLSAAAIGDVSLSVQTIQSGDTEYDMIPMQLDASDNLFKAVIPALYSGGDAFYSITLTDFLGNTITIANNFHVKYLGTNPDYVVIGNRSSTSWSNPYPQRDDYGWSRNLYLASEINPAATGTVITSLSWSVKYAAAMTRSPQSCYLKAVSETNITREGWENPGLNGATLVWKGGLRADTGWNEINFNQPFNLPKGQNLMVYWVDSTGASNSMSSFEFHSSAAVDDMAVYDCMDDEFPRYTNNENGSLGTNRPDIRFYVHLMDEPDSNAVALNSILIPSHVDGGTTVDVKAVIENAGLKDLDSCRIYWKRNDIQQPPMPYYLYNNKSLGRNVTDTIIIGSYLALSGQRDEIEVWVSMPNGVTDGDNSDDTLQIVSITCGNTPLSGNVLIGESSFADYRTISEAISSIAFCGMSDKVILEVEDGYYPESLDFTILNNLLTQTDTVELRSLSGNASDVIVESRNCVVRLGSSDNIILKNITLNVISEGFGIYFTDSCNNIEINGCMINLDTTLAKQLTRATTHVGIYKFNDTKAAHNVRILNNTITGGYSAVYVYGGPTSGNYGTGWVFDSNTIRNAYMNNAFVYYVDFLSVSHNIFISMEDKNYVSSSWYGLYFNYCNAEIIANNRINAIKHPNLLQPRAMFFNYLNRNTTPAKIYNNEILMSKAGSLTQNIFTFTSSSADIYHNSMYIEEALESRCYVMSISTTYPTNVRNNNIVITKSRLISIDNASVVSNYNNFHTGGSGFGSYLGREVADFASWKPVSGKDANSVNVLPTFVDISTSMEMSDSWIVFCPMIPDVTQDINGDARRTTTTMGAYTIHRFPDPEAITEIHNWSTEDIVNQIKPVEVVLTNLSSQELETVVLEWTLNGGTPVSYTWNAPAPLAFLEQAVITLSSFPVSANTDVKIWITTLNTSTTFMLEDTLDAHSQMKPLAEFVAPLVNDTISSLSFDIHTLIRPQTGALKVNPRMNLQTIVNESVILYDTIDMVLKDGIWITSVPQQFYFSKIIYSVTISDTINNRLTIMDSTYIQFMANDSIWYPYNNLSIFSIEKLVADSVLCSGDYAPVEVILANTGNEDYDLSANPIILTVEVTNPLPFYKDSIINTGTLQPGQRMGIVLTDELPIIVAGQYDVKASLSISGIDLVPADDTLTMYYVSGKFGLPVDEDFSSPELPLVFRVEGNTSNVWKPVLQGTGADTAVKPQHGTGMLAFSGTPGAISTLFTRQLDLSRTIQPALSFWYFHDTVPCDDYTNVRITVDGGATYTTILPLTKYNSIYGWKEYNIDLPTFAINQCVILVFDAMESLNGNVTQYIDRIRITAKQEITITDIITSDFSVCDLEDKEWKVVLTNFTAPDLHYDVTPVEITLELEGTSYSFVETKSTGTLKGFSSDTITLKTDFDFTKGKYIAKANISSIFGPVFTDTIDISPKFKIEIVKLSEGGKAEVGFEHKQVIILKNEGNMDLSEIELILSVNLPEAAPHFIITKITDRNLSPGDTMHVTFDSAYTVPNSSTYEVTVNSNLVCAPALVYAVDSKLEEVDTEDLALIEIVKPEDDETEDIVGNPMEVSIKIENKSLAHAYYPGNVKVGYMLIGSDGNRIGVPIEEEVDASIGSGATIPFTFETKYTVPTVKEYTLVVYIKEKDKYNQNDTLKMDRITDYDVSIPNIDKESFTLEQNFPNPAKDKTVINYNIPQDGEIKFAVYSVNGQLLYSQKENAISLDNQIELNISDYASGIYFYTMEYKGQRIVKKMSVRR
jgi:hypothetical protein